MGSPKVKLYQLPQGFTEEADSDVQSRVADQLLPVVDKLTLIENVRDSDPLTPVYISDHDDLLCFDLAGGRVTQNLIANPNKFGYFICASGSWSSYLWQPTGALAPIVKTEAGEVIPVTQYTVTENGISFAGVLVGATVEIYQRAAVADSSHFAFHGDTFYRGLNTAWNRLLVSIDGGEYEPMTAPADGTGYITLAGVAASAKASYAIIRTKARFFLSEHVNWVGGHLKMWPDIFVGEYEYPGNNYVDANSNPVRPGLLPLFRDPGTYTIHFRDGMVEFPEKIDTAAAANAGVVKANVAYIAGVDNVTGQLLTVVPDTGNRTYKASSEVTFPASHDKRLVGRNDQYMPFNVYVDGQLTPVPQIVPTEVLGIKRA